MNFNIDEERAKLIQVINDNTFDFLKFSKKNIITFSNQLMNFLWLVLTLTSKYPHVELYLKNLLDFFTINELKNVCSSWSILHYMCKYPSNISPNAFEIIINYGVDVNIKSTHNSTVAHILFDNKCDSNTNSVLNLLIKNGINLNIMNFGGLSVLDVITYYQKELNEETKNCAITIIDHGGRTNKPKKDNVIYDFIEYYEYSTIKPAIKNENNI